MSIWVTADLHFNHPGILKTARPQFSSVQEHNEFIVKEYNEYVQKDDLVYILGDIGFTPFPDLKPWIQKLNGRKILITGNHDKGSKGILMSLGFIDVIDHPFYYSSNIILSHQPDMSALNNPYVYNIHGHLHLPNAYLTLDNYINVNVELTEFKPIDLKKMQEKIASVTKSRKETFGNEWYFKYYKQV